MGPQGPAGPAGPAGTTSQEIAISAAAATNFTVPAAWTDVTGLTGVVVPQGTPDFVVEVLAGLMVAITTGTVAATVPITVEARILDDQGFVVCYGSVSVTGAGGTSVVLRDNISLEGPVSATAASAGARVYRVQAQLTTTGTNGQSAQILLATANRYLQARVR